ncbi:MAG: VWA domain-containing protein [Chloroflexi bacterium]|nr:VWA domain-containing protein [Chloroflexota bacterium]
MYVSFSNPSALWALLIFLPLLALSFLGRAGRPMLRRWVGVGLRLLVGLGLIIALAGAQTARPTNDLAAVFLLDLSDSVSAAEQERAKQFIHHAVTEMPSGARVAIVAFGQDALVEQLASEIQDLAPITSVPRSGRTDIGAALRLGLALFPEESQKRLVLLSDGQENIGDALAQANLAAARGAEIAIVPLLAPQAAQEAYLEDVQVPSSVRQGQTFAVIAVVESTLAQEAKMYLLGDGQLLASETVSLQPGTNRIELGVTAKETGFRRYQVELIPTLDTLPQNNLASGFTIVYGPPRVLIAEGNPGEADDLRQALESAEVEVTVVAPMALSSNVATLAGYDAVVLVNAPAAELSARTMNALPVIVRELGRGLVMVGGEQAFGAGGYLHTPVEEALPVDMDVPNRTEEPEIALALVLDKSGSMADYPCQSAVSGRYALAQGRSTKVDIAKDAAIRASSVLQSSDYLGVIAFDDIAQWAYPLQPLADAAALRGAVASIQADGGTNIWAGLIEAERALVEKQVRVKHIILLSDGWSDYGDYDALTSRFAEEGITLSIVAAGCDTAEYLPELAEKGGGRFYAAPTMQDVPRIFLKEAVEAIGAYIVEEPFYPLPSGTTLVLRGLDPATLPHLWGYNSTVPKATAQVGLISARGDPVLAQWQYGLGRAVAWTPDLKGQWAADWVDWEQFNTFAAQLVGWTLPDPADEGLQTTPKLDGADIRLQVDSVDEDGRPRDLLETEAILIGPDLSESAVTLDQTAAGRYEGSLSVGEPGTYLVQITQRDQEGQAVAHRMTGLAVPYSPEYKQLGQGDALLNELAGATGGATLKTPVDAFAPTRRPTVRTRPLWPVLLLLAALVFPVDVAIRRLRLTKADWQRLTAWLRVRWPSRRARRRSAEPVVLGDLFQARERARRRGMRPTGRGEDVSFPAHSLPEPLIVEEVVPSSASSDQTVPLPTDNQFDGDTLARLRQARERARRR